MPLETHARDRKGRAQACGIPAAALPAFRPMGRHFRPGGVRAPSRAPRREPLEPAGRLALEAA